MVQKPLLTNLAGVYQAARGQSVDVRLKMSVEAGVKSLVVAIDNEASTIEVTRGEQNGEILYTYTVPIGAELGAFHSLLFTATDLLGESSELEVRVITDSLIFKPEIYTFERNGQSSVNHSGQTERLQMVTALKKYISKAEKGDIISEEVLLDAFENTGGDAHGFYDFQSSKQLKDKTFAPDLDQSYFEDLFYASAQASVAGNKQQIAKPGLPGLMLREDKGKMILLDAQGRELTQLIEKGLMGSVMLHQMLNTYLTDKRIGAEVENIRVEEGVNYTKREHHWDEAIGYFHPPDHFSSDWKSSSTDTLVYWTKYSNVVDPLLGTNDQIMQAFIKGRTAIVNNDPTGMWKAREALYTQMEVLVAAISIHYINSTLNALEEAKTGEALHYLSEAWAFARTLLYHPERRVPLEDLYRVLNEDLSIDGSFWDVTPSGLGKARDFLASHYQEFINVKDQL